MPGRSNPYNAEKKRTTRQVRALQHNVRRTLTALDKAYPDTHRCKELLSQHQQRVTKILNAGRKPAQAIRICLVCGKAILPPATYWTDSLYFKLLWPPGVYAVFMFSLYQFGMWGLLVPLAAVVVSLSFWYSIVIPTILFVIVLIVLLALGI
jgi:hypothetical protein